MKEAAVGLHRILHRNKRGELRLRSGSPTLFEASLLFGWAVFLMMALHLVEIVIWAVALVYMGLVPRIPNAIFACALLVVRGYVGDVGDWVPDATRLLLNRRPVDVWFGKSEVSHGFRLARNK